jgi:sugar O-acyltransferase (sialic acid O-acetyltransferase NeuD family)
MNQPVIIVGAGGHAAVVADALLAAGRQVLGFTDVDGTRHGATLCGLPVLGDDGVLDGYSHRGLELANGLGGVGGTTTAEQRRRVQEQLSARGWRFVTVRHPRAVVSPFASIGEAAQLLAASVLQPGARIGPGCIVNTAAVIEHGVVLGAWVHVAPCALLCGDVAVGARSFVGAGAVVRQGVRLGEDTVVGAGAVVVKDFAGRALLAGIPARRVESQQ